MWKLKTLWIFAKFFSERSAVLEFKILNFFLNFMQSTLYSPMWAKSETGRQILLDSINIKPIKVIWLAHQLMHIYKIVYIKTLQSLQYVSILRSSSGNYTVPR